MSLSVTKDPIWDLKNEILSNQNMLKDYLQFKFDRLASDVDLIVKKIELLQTQQDKNVTELLKENAQLRKKVDLSTNRMVNSEQYNGRNTNFKPGAYNVRGKFNSEVQGKNADKFRQGRRMIKDPELNLSGNSNRWIRRTNSDNSVDSKGQQNMLTSMNVRDSSRKYPEMRVKHRRPIKSDPGKGSSPTAVDILEEFIFNKDFEEACLCVELYISLEDKKNLIKKMIDYAFSSKSSNFHELGSLFAALVVRDVIDSTFILEILCEYLDDTMKYETWIDIPNIFQYFSEALVPLIAYSVLNLSDVSKMCQPHREHSAQYIKKLALIIIGLLTEKFDSKWMMNRWTRSKLQPSDFGFDLQDVNDCETLQFISSTSDISDSSVLSMNELQSKLVDLMQENVARGELSEWVRVHVGESVLEPAFINALTTAICEVSFDPSEQPFTEIGLKIHSNLIRRYITIPGNHDLDVQCLIAVANFVHKLDHPKGLLLMIFNYLWDTSLIEDEAFMSWRNREGMKERESKALQSLEYFFIKIDV